jgi:hypothetical protein
MSAETKGFADWMDGYKHYQTPNSNDPEPNFLEKYWWVGILIGFVLYILL